MTSEKWFVEMMVNAKSGCTTFLYGSKKMKTILTKKVQAFRDCAETDYEIGVITIGKYREECHMHFLMVESLKYMDVI